MQIKCKQYLNFHILNWTSLYYK